MIRRETDYLNPPRGVDRRYGGVFAGAQPALAIEPFTTMSAPFCASDGVYLVYRIITNDSNVQAQVTLNGTVVRDRYYPAGYMYGETVYAPASLLVDENNVMNTVLNGVPSMVPLVFQRPRCWGDAGQKPAQATSIATGKHYRYDANVGFTPPAEQPVATPTPTPTTTATAAAVVLRAKSPKLIGTPKVSKKLTCKGYAAKPKAVLTRDWLVNGQAVGRHGKKLNLKKIWLGQTVQCRATYTRAGSDTLVLDSPAKLVKNK